MRYVYLATFFLAALTVSVLGFRGSISTKSPIELIPDMDHQAKYKSQAESPFFADGRTDRPLPAGVVPYGRTSVSPDGVFLAADDEFYMWKTASGDWLQGFPKAVKVDARLMSRGQEQFTIYCASCHGALGDGNGITKQYGMGATPTYHDDRLRKIAEGEIYNTMLSQADKVAPVDRWAVIAYIRALQRAQNGTAADVPPSHKAELGLK